MPRTPRGYRDGFSLKAEFEPSPRPPTGSAARACPIRTNQRRFRYFRREYRGSYRRNFSCAMVNQDRVGLEIPAEGALSGFWGKTASDEPVFRQKRVFAALAERRHPSNWRPAATISSSGDQSRKDTPNVTAVQRQAKLNSTDQF
jgi:hypothetical protein